MLQKIRATLKDILRHQTLRQKREPIKSGKSETIIYIKISIAALLFLFSTLKNSTTIFNTFSIRSISPGLCFRENR